jgi:hypothetical protein
VLAASTATQKMGRSTASDSIQDNGLKTERKPSAA